MRPLLPTVAALAAAVLLPAGAARAAPARPAARPAAPARPAATAAADFAFRRLDHAYGQPVAAAPVRAGKLVVRLASPRNKIVLRSHRLRLAPTYADGSYAAELTVDFFGKGRLVADVDLAGYGHRFEEEVLVPPQTKVLGGRVRVARSAGGYLVTPLSLPATLAVRIQSQVGNDVVGFCERLAAVPFSDLDCDGLDRALSTAVVPLPPAGEGFWIGPGDVSAAERQQLERYLAATGSRGSRGGRARGAR
jgi:hypothetical protein